MSRCRYNSQAAQLKPLTYAAAMMPDEPAARAGNQARSFGMLAVDYEQSNGVTYSPVNYDNRFHGPVRLRAALANSYNIPAVLLLQDIGVPTFLSFAQQMGLTTFGDDASRYGLSITLGGAEVTPLELTAAYAVFANEGYRVPPISVLQVTKSDGELIYEYSPPAAAEPVVDPQIAYVISDFLADDAARIPAMGRNNPLDLPFPAAAKTGTTNDFRDNWTIGYTPGLVVGVWAGNTDNSEMINVSGLTGAAPLWNDYMAAVYNDFGLLSVLSSNGAQPPTEFVPPVGMAKQPLCNLGSIVPGATDCSYAGQEWVLDNVNTVSPTPISADQLTEEELDPSVVRTAAVQLAPLPSDLIEISEPADDEALPPLESCHFASGTPLAELPTDAAVQVYLRPPRNAESLKSAYEWGQASGVAILPYQSCTEELLAAGRDPNAPAIWRITEPKAGEVVDGILPIIGTADFRSEDVQFYKIELGIPQDENLAQIEWLTLGETHTTPVVNGTLEMLHAAGLPPGDYFIRLIVIQWDGNYVGEPHTIPITIERS